MSGDVLTIMQKEFARFFGDRRLLLMLLLPGVMIYVVYSFIGSAAREMYTPDADYVPGAYVAGLPASVSDFIADAGARFLFIEIGTQDVPDAEAAKEKVTAKKADLCVIFPPEFDALVENYDVRTSQGPAPNIEIYCNSADVNSLNAYGTLIGLLDMYETSLVNKFDINREVPDPDLAREEDTQALLISSIMPMLLMVFLYSGCIGIAPESIAGEKERGTIGALLVSPLKRSRLAVGKILSLGVLAFLAGLVSAAATILALPKLMGTNESLAAGIYGAGDYFFLALVILSTILLLVSLISCLSAFAKTVKEAGMIVVPVMIVVMLVGVTGMFSAGAPSKGIYYIIPFYNSVQSMSGIFSLGYSGANIVLTAVSNVVYACVGGFVLTKMFNSEKVMFSR
ncbi:MAG: ABC transporter permease [Oscillospiraceae bacterium]|nr:ABC transporter permease [Oscillospiraceae bacterium]